MIFVIYQDQFLQMAMETSPDDADNESFPTTSEKHKPKKHKKHKKSKKSAITLDEFLNMNTDVFGEDLDFQGVEEVPTRMVAKQLKKVKKDNPVNIGSATKISAANLQKLKQQGIIIKTKNSNNFSVVPGMKVNVANNHIIGNPVKIASHVLNTTVNQTKPTLQSQTKSQIPNKLKLMKTSKEIEPEQEKIKILTQNANSELTIKPVQRNKTQIIETPNIDSEEIHHEKDKEKSLKNIECDTEDQQNSIDTNEEINKLKDICTIRSSLQTVENEKSKLTATSMAKLNVPNVAYKKSTVTDNISEKKDVNQQLCSDNAIVNINENQVNETRNIDNKNSNETRFVLLSNSQITVKPINRIIPKSNINMKMNIPFTSDKYNDNSINVDNSSDMEDFDTVEDNNTNQFIQEYVDSSKHKLLSNSELTVKPMSSQLTTSNLNKPVKDNFGPLIERSEGQNKKINTTKLSNVSGVKYKQHTLNSQKKLPNQSEVTIKSNITEQSDYDDDFEYFEPLNKIPIKQNVHNEVDSTDENFPNYYSDESDDADMQNNSSNTKHQVNKIKQESLSSTTDKLLQNAQLSIKSAMLKIKTQVRNLKNDITSSTNEIQTIEDSGEDDLSEDIVSQNTYHSVKASRIQNEKMNLTKKSINALKNIGGITIKSNMLDKFDSEDIINQDMPDDHFDGIDDDSYEDHDGDDDISQFKPTTIKTQIPKNHVDNTLNKFKNKIGAGVTLKSISNTKEEYSDDIEHNLSSFDEDSDSKEDEIVNKLRNSNQGLQIKPIKKDFPEKTKNISKNTQIDNQTRGLKREGNKLVNSKESSITPQKQIKMSQQTSNEKPVQQLKKTNHEIVSKNPNQGSQLNKESLTNEGNTVSQEVTVKTVQTKTVIQEITTTVTKTIRTLNQTTNSEVIASSSNNAKNNAESPLMKVQRTVQGMKLNQQPVRNVNQGMPIRNIAGNKQGIQVQNIRPIVKSCNNPMPQTLPVIRQGPRQPSFASPRPTKGIPVLKKVGTVVQPSTSQTNHALGKVLKVAPNVRNQPTKMMNKEVTKTDSSGPFSCFKKSKESLIPGSEVSNVSTMQMSSEKKLTMASHVSKSNFSNIRTTVKTGSMSSQVKSEFKSSSNTNISQQLTKLGNASGLKIVRTSQAQQEQSLMETSMENKSNNCTLIEKLQKQGLLIKKPRLDLNLDDNSDSDDFNVESENQYLDDEGGG